MKLLRFVAAVASNHLAKGIMLDPVEHECVVNSIVKSTAFIGSTLSLVKPNEPFREDQIVREWRDVQSNAARRLQDSDAAARRNHDGKPATVLIVQAVRGEKATISRVRSNMEYLRRSPAGDFRWALFHYEDIEKWKEQDWYRTSPDIIRREVVHAADAEDLYLRRVTVKDLQDYDYIWLMNDDVDVTFLEWELYSTILAMSRPLVSQPALFSHDYRGRGSDSDGQTMMQVRDGELLVAAERRRSEELAPVLSKDLWLAVHSRASAKAATCLTDLRMFWDIIAFLGRIYCNISAVAVLNAAPVNYMDCSSSSSVPNVGNCTADVSRPVSAESAAAVREVCKDIPPNWMARWGCEKKSVADCLSAILEDAYTEPRTLKLKVRQYESSGPGKWEVDVAGKASMETAASRKTGSVASPLESLGPRGETSSSSSKETAASRMTGSVASPLESLGPVGETSSSSSKETAASRMTGSVASPLESLGPVGETSSSSSKETPASRMTGSVASPLESLGPVGETSSSPSKEKDMGGPQSGPSGTSPPPSAARDPLQEMDMAGLPSGPSGMSPPQSRTRDPRQETPPSEVTEWVVSPAASPGPEGEVSSSPNRANGVYEEMDIASLPSGPVGMPPPQSRTRDPRKEAPPVIGRVASPTGSPGPEGEVYSSTNRANWGREEAPPAEVIGRVASTTGSPGPEGEVYSSTNREVDLQVSHSGARGASPPNMTSHAPQEVDLQVSHSGARGASPPNMTSHAPQEPRLPQSGPSRKFPPPNWADVRQDPRVPQGPPPNWTEVLQDPRMPQNASSRKLPPSNSTDFRQETPAPHLTGSVASPWTRGETSSSPDKETLAPHLTGSVASPLKSLGTKGENSSSPNKETPAPHMTGSVASTLKSLGTKGENSSSPNKETPAPHMTGSVASTLKSLGTKGENSSSPNKDRPLNNSSDLNFSNVYPDKQLSPPPPQSVGKIVRSVAPSQEPPPPPPVIQHVQERPHYVRVISVAPKPPPPVAPASPHYVVRGPHKENVMVVPRKDIFLLSPRGHR
eukprot:TRINITY_DN1016_c0_g1_i8.p1 TRINITY_DN1016_c0_g1~~TRINITY_DN1016_c0_g1_i8.p1  ORF type:complete len:1034 (-),score=168.56 TRINITY_DN1016_c0_g1_i8:162-3263(-)